MCLPLTTPCGEISLGGLAALAGAARKGFALADLDAVRVAAGLVAGFSTKADAGVRGVRGALSVTGIPLAFAKGLATGFALVGRGFPLD
jgi:hypothetical protein